MGHNGSPERTAIKSLTQHFKLSVAMATNQNEESCTTFVCLVGEDSTNIKKKQVVSKYLK